MMKIRELALADALLFAALALTLAFMGHRGQNLYFLIAAAAFVAATYLTYPPAWLLDFAKSRDSKTRRK